ncbi:MAG: GNAT family N-acetyltransferase [Bacteroidales bacterium]|nr:GNAT family N-acetyltransferase [Bacteroidales bacterium]
MDNNTTDELKKIWKDIFQDSDTYIDNVFNGISNDQAFYIKDVGNIVSMAFMTPYDLKVNDRIVKCGYFFGAATLPEKRNKGYMEKIIDMTKIAAKKNNMSAIILIPATTSLFNYYKRFDFRMAFGYSLKMFSSSVSKKEISDYELIGIKNDLETYDFFSLAERKKDISILHSKDQFDKILLEYTEDNFHSLALVDKNSGTICALLFAEPTDNGSFIVKDILFLDSNYRDISLELFLKVINKQEIIVKEASNNISSIPFAMIYDISNEDTANIEKGYISLMME